MAVQNIVYFLSCAYRQIRSMMSGWIFRTNGIRIRDLTNSRNAEIVGFRVIHCAMIL